MELSEEEKKAIKILNDYIERKRATRTVYNTEDIIFDNIIILLKLLEQQTEIEERNKSNYISKDKIREKIEELENKNEKNKIELAKGIDTLNFDTIENAKNNIAINVNTRDILQELLEENNAE